MIDRNPTGSAYIYNDKKFVRRFSKVGKNARKLSKLFAEGMNEIKKDL